MQDRAARLKRLATVQRHMEKMAELELAELQQDREKLVQRIDALADAMTSPNPIHTGFSRLYGLQIATLKSREQILAGRSRMVEKKLIGERAKADRLDERFKDARQQDERDAEDQAVYDLLDTLWLQPGQASRKLRSS